MNTNPPSTTITAATLAMMVGTLLVEGAMQFGVELRPSFCAAFVTCLGGLVGYFTPEKRYGWGQEDKPE